MGFFIGRRLMSKIPYYKQVEVGKTYNLWTVTDVPFRSPDNYYRWLAPCRCNCGTEKTVDAPDLINGKSKGCGCTRAESVRLAVSTHGETVGGARRSRLYEIWAAMVQRCTNPRSGDYPDYGGRGIVICDEWRRDYAVFREWSVTHEYRDGLVIDRIDNNKGYSPDNCRWATPLENARNKRNTIILTAFGETKSLSEWSEDPRCPVGHGGLYKRVVIMGWTLERSLSTPSLMKRRS